MQKTTAADSLDSFADQFCTVAQAAALLGVSTSTIWRWVKSGRLPALRVGPRSIRIRRLELRRAVHPVSSSEVSPPAPRYLTELSQLAPLTKEERARRMDLFKEMQAALDEQRARNGGKPLPDSAPLIRAAREERSRRL